MLYQLVSKFGKRVDWKSHGAHQPARLMIANGRLTATKARAADQIMRLESFPVSRRRARSSAGRIKPGNTFAAAPRPSSVPVHPSALRWNAHNPAHIKNTARRSQLWNA